MLRIIISLLFVLLCISNAKSDTKIVFLDFDFLLNNSIKGKQIRKNLELINSKNIKQLKLNEKNLQEEKKKF